MTAGMTELTLDVVGSALFGHGMADLARRIGPDVTDGLRAAERATRLLLLANTGTRLRSINLDGVAYGCYAFGPAMIERGRGQIVNVASAAAYLPQPEHGRLLRHQGGRVLVLPVPTCRLGGKGGRGQRDLPGADQHPDRVPLAAVRPPSPPDRSGSCGRSGFRLFAGPRRRRGIVRAVERNQAIVPVGLSIGARLPGAAVGPGTGFTGRWRRRTLVDPSGASRLRSRPTGPYGHRPARLVIG